MAVFRNYLRKELQARWYGNPGALRILTPLAWLYGLLVRSRRQRFPGGQGTRTATSPGALEVPVIVVGNLVVGGTGKTPVVMDVVERLRSLGAAPGVVARGYGGKGATWPRVVSAVSDPKLCGDESVEVAAKLGCPVVVSPDRNAAARWLVEFFGCDVIVSDDGLQHYRLERSLELAVIDAVRCQGNGRLLPVGPLREPVARLSSVDCIIKTARANEVGGRAAGMLETDTGEGAHELSGALTVPQLFAVLRPVSATHLLSSETVPLADAPFVGKPCVALSAIGNPGRFHDDLAALGCALTTRALADHDSYGDFVADWPWESLVVTTGKDAVKLATLTGHCASVGASHSTDWLQHVWVLNRDLVFSDQHAVVLEQLLSGVLRSKDPATDNTRQKLPRGKTDG